MRRFKSFLGCSARSGIEDKIGFRIGGKHFDRKNTAHIEIEMNFRRGISWQSRGEIKRTGIYVERFVVLHDAVLFVGFAHGYVGGSAGYYVVQLARARFCRSGYKNVADKVFILRRVVNLYAVAFIDDIFDDYCFAALIYNREAFFVALRLRSGRIGGIGRIWRTRPARSRPVRDRTRTPP